MMSTTGLGARKFILNEYDKDTLNDIANYGCISGCAPDFIYTADITRFFDSHKDEIEEELELVFGEDYLHQLIKEDEIDIDTLKTRMTWSFVELVAQSEVWM